jgi:hypothetical protein
MLRATNPADRNCISSQLFSTATAHQRYPFTAGILQRTFHYEVCNTLNGAVLSNQTVRTLPLSDNRAGFRILSACIDFHNTTNVTTRRMLTVKELW